MKTVWFYCKQIIIPLLYSLFATMIALGILCIEDKSLIWLKVVLLILNFALFAFIVVINFFKEGQSALKIRMANDMEREQIVRTGENRPLKLLEEYKPWKGYLIGLISTLPLIILLIVHTILYLTSGTTTVGGIAAFIYMFVFGFNCLDLSAMTNTLAQTQPYILLVLIPIMVVLVGVPYMLGARKIELQQEQIKEKHRQIYGE